MSHLRVSWKGSHSKCSPKSMQNSEFSLSSFCFNLSLPLSLSFCLYPFSISLSLPQLALGQGARRLHVSAALSAKAKVAMSRFEPSSHIKYENMQNNVNIVRKRFVSALNYSTTQLQRGALMCQISAVCKLHIVKC